MIETYTEAKYEKRKVSQLENYDQNPRTITDQEFERLKKQLDYLGVYKPLLINQDNIVLGGNMRLRALKDLGIKEVMCAVVLTDNEAQKMEYALSDNDSVGVTDEEKIAEFATSQPELKSDLFAIHSKPAKLVSKITAKVSPGPDEGTKCRQCPEHCGMENI